MLIGRPQQRSAKKYTRIIRIKAETKIKGTERPKAENGRYVNRIFKDAQRDPRKDAVANLAAAVGQRKRSNSAEKDEGPLRTVQWLIQQDISSLSILHKSMSLLGDQVVELLLRHYTVAISVCALNHFLKNRIISQLPEVLGNFSQVLKSNVS